MGNIKGYYEDDPSRVFRTGMMDLLTFEVQGCTRPAQTLKEELMLAASDIYNTVPDIHIALSGGWESNVCLHTFMEAGYKPRVMILEFPRGLNDFDTDPAKEACRRYGITPTIVPVDMSFLDFIKNAVVPVVEKYQTYTFFQSLFAYYLEKTKINCLLVDKVDLRRDLNPNGQWSFIRSEVATWTDRFNTLNENKVLMNFYCHSPEAMLAYLELPTIVDLMNHPKNGKLSLQSLKHKIYLEGGYNIPLFTRTVSTDKIIGVTAACEEKIKKDIGWKTRIGYVEYPKIVQALKSEGGKWQYI